jgi:50S ribosomal protein L16 3-hydroxylase
LQKHPAEIGQSMTSRVASMLQQLTWNQSDIADFLGQYLSEPKVHVVFQPPRSMSLQAFHKKLQKTGIALDGRSQLLFHRDRFFMNGETCDVTGPESVALTRLADHRNLPPDDFADMVLVNRLHGWYLAGYLQWL